MSILLSVQSLEKSYGEKLLFEGLSFVLSKGERIGLIGPNGAGKSTLLHILGGNESADSGQLIPTQGLRLSFLEQDPAFARGATVESLLSEALPSLDSWERRQKMEEAFWRYGINASEITFDRKLEELSGGWRKRIFILKELLKEPDLLLMDEPTNHLDVQGIVWLEKILESASFASLTVTHDRYFLNKVANRILELDSRHLGGILSVNGNYTRYLEIRESMLEAQESREQSLRGVLRRETEWLKAGVKARTTKQQARIDRHSVLSGELSELSRRNQEERARLDFQSAKEQPKRLLEVKHLSKKYPGSDQSLFEDFELVIRPGMIFGILGENACGKSSLIRILIGEETATQGKIFRSDLLKVAYFEQGKDQIDPRVSLVKVVCPEGDQVYFQGRYIHVRSYLERFLFRQDKMDLEVGSLSGGEKSRLLLARLMLIEANLLILDEPTNDLDIPTLNVLEDCLSSFEGAVLLVTHDRFFLERVSDQLIAFPPKSAELSKRELKMFSSFEQWESWMASFESRGSSQSAAEVKFEKEGASPKGDKHYEAQTKNLMKKIEKLESQKSELEERCASPEMQTDLKELSKLSERLEKLDSELQLLYESWTQLEEETSS